jgi:signal transduction histidine kinase/CheY-like chemotaxis protein
LATLDRLMRNTIRQYSDTKDTKDTNALPETQNSSSALPEAALTSLKNTFIRFVQERNQTAQKRNVAITSQLMLKQNDLYTTNERTTTQINQMIKGLESYEYQNNLNRMNVRIETLESSSKTFFIIAIIAIIFSVIFFGGLVYFFIINQRLRNKIDAGKKHTEKLLNSREQLLLTITHDIKAPVSSILGYLELMKEDHPSSQHTYYIDNMRQSATHISNLIRNLLNFHSLEITLQKRDQLPFAPNELLTDIYESFIPDARKKELQFDLNIDIDESENYISDPYRIRQILSNILSNAIKFTPQTGSVFLSGILVKSKRKTELLLSVKDTGPGIREEDINRIFEEFRRLDYTKGEGLGLGLNISHKLAQSLGGSISVDSTIGKGSIFTVVLPLSKTDPEATKAIHDNINKSQKILFIDNDAIHLDLLSTLLKREGMLAHTCSGSMDALNLLQKEHFDIIFSDIQMPDLNGFELVTSIRTLGFEGATTVPIIGLSANSYLSESKYKEAGFSEFLTKPFTSEQLLEVIHKYTQKEAVATETLEREKITEPIEAIEAIEVPEIVEVAETSDIIEPVEEVAVDIIEPVGIIEPVEEAAVDIGKEPAQVENGFKALIDFAGDDPDAGTSIIRSFIIETGKNHNILNQAFENDDWNTIKDIAHKMLPLMKMISAKNLVSLLQDYVNGSKSKENSVLLLSLIQEKMREAESISFESIE